MNNDKLNEAIKTIRELCKAKGTCMKCPMKGNCGDIPADWEEVKGGAE